nr:MAG TPA: hypothetical protein [Caudoviricetes sp.]
MCTSPSKLIRTITTSNININLSRFSSYRILMFRIRI